MPLGIFNKIRSSMSAKIGLIVSLSVVLIAAIFSYYHHRYERDLISRSAEIRLLHIGEGLKGSAEAFIEKNDLAGLAKVIDRESLEADVEAITLYNNLGRVIAGNKNKRIGKRFLDMYPDEIGSEDIAAIQKALAGGYSVYYDPHDMMYCLVMPVSFGNEVTGAIQICLSFKTAQAEIRQRAVENISMSILVALLIGIAIYFLFYNLFTKRVKSVSSVAAKFALGDMAARTDVEGADEIGYLANSFNALAEEIANWRSNLEKIAASRTKEISALYDVVDTINKSLELNKVLPKVFDLVLENVGVGKGVLVLVGTDGKTLTIMSHRGLSDEGMRQISELGQGCTGDVILKNTPIRVGGGDDEESPAFPGLDQEKIRSALVVPIAVRGSVLGALAVYSENMDKFSEQDEAFLETIGSQVGAAVENARLYEKTLELAQMDGLTGLANRRYLMQRLQQEVDRAERYTTSLSVLILDLDKFKSFNDTYGHLKGDELLRMFSTLLKSLVRSSDIAGRYGGEEFCVVLPNTSIKGAGAIAEHIRMAMEELKVPMGEGQSPAGRTVSIGVAEFSMGDSVEKLISTADAALYRAKESGRNRVAA